jgi:carotenoid 1,2-hydratase
MPTIPMYIAPTVPDAWHQVAAPGGYEWWYFDAEQQDSGLRIVIILFQGFVFHPGYLRQYAKFRRRPTKVAPPVPADFPCAYFVVYRGDKILAQFMTQHPKDSFAAAVDRADVTVGPNSLKSAGDGTMSLSVTGVPWVLTGRGPQTLDGQTLSGKFEFRPRLVHPPMERTFFDRTWAGADHRWIVANPLCEVMGEIRFGGEKLSFAGRGYHDHNFGTGPIGPGLDRWIWGRVLLKDHVLMFHHADPNDWPGELHLVEADSYGMRELSGESFIADWDRRTSTLLRYPNAIDVGPMSLRHPKVVDASPFYLRIAYEAAVRGETGTAFCEVAYPHRLRWPVLGRMIEMSVSHPEPEASARESPR